MEYRTAVLGSLRISLGLVFLWAFFDKLIGLGFRTCADMGLMCERAWLSGGSPTTGYLGGVEGPFAGIFNAISGVALVDWLFMLGLLGIGLAFTFGIAMRLGAWSAFAMLMLMWFASFPIANNPFIDDHLVYALLALALPLVDAGKHLGVHERWTSLSIVQKYAWLR